MSDRESLHRQRQTRLFEEEAETLATYQLDLLAELERQIRAVHQAMRHIEKLRSVKERVGPELSNRQREGTLSALATAISDLESHVDTEHECCGSMQSTITQMRERIAALRERASEASHPAIDLESSRESA